MRSPRGLEITARGDREMEMTREFHAPRRMVFDAYTKPEILKRWLGRQNGWFLDVCEIDLRVGGAYRWVWRNPEGFEMGMGGVYLEIDAPERLVFSEKFDQSWYPGEGVGTLVLLENDGWTTLTQTMRYESREARDAVLESPMESGVSAGFAMLEEVLATLPADEPAEIA